METTRYGQTFYEQEANELVGYDTCTCDRDGGGCEECNWCDIYYNGPCIEEWEL